MQPWLPDVLLAVCRLCVCVLCCQVSASAWMSLIMSAFLGFLALTVVLATFYVMRSWSVWLGRTRGRRLPTELAGLGGYGGMAQVSGSKQHCAGSPGW